MSKNELNSGILPVNTHAEVNRLNLNYITALYFILLPLYCQIICTIINNRGACCNICFKALYFLDQVSVPTPIAIDILKDAMARDRVHMYLFSV